MFYLTESQQTVNLFFILTKGGLNLSWNWIYSRELFRSTHQEDFKIFDWKKKKRQKKILNKPVRQWQRVGSTRTSKRNLFLLMNLRGKGLPRFCTAIYFLSKNVAAINLDEQRFHLTWQYNTLLFLLLFLSVILCSCTLR